MALEGTVKLPVFGTVSKKTAALAGGGSVVLVVGIYWYRQRKASNAAAAAASQAQQSSSSTSDTTGMVTDPAGNVCSSEDIDPETGYCSGSEEDQQALANLNASEDDLADASTGSTSPTSTTTAFENNAAWAQAAESYLGSNGADATAAAIAKYIAGQAITTTQETIVEEAIAAEGYPPVAGANGYPPSMNVQATTTNTTVPPDQTTTTTTTTSTVTVPKVTGMRIIADALPALQKAGLVGKITGGGFNSDEENYAASQTPGAGTKVAAGSTVDLGDIYH